MNVSSERYFDSKALINKFENLETTIVKTLNQKATFDCDLMNHNHDIAADNTMLCFEQNNKMTIYFS